MELTTYEYGVDKKREGKLRILTVALIFLYVAFVGGTFGVLYWIRLIPLCAVLPLLLWILVFFTWRYVQVDDVYYIESGNFTLIRKFGNRSKRTLTEFRIKDAELIAPLSDYEGTVNEYNATVTIDARPSVSAADIYVVLYKNKDGKRCKLLFQATAQAIKSLRYYNEKTVVSATSV